MRKFITVDREGVVFGNEEMNAGEVVFIVKPTDDAMYLITVENLIKLVEQKVKAGKVKILSGKK